MPREHQRSRRFAPLDHHDTELDDRALGYGVGDVVAGKYELVRLIGSGGMGAVWRVRHLIIDAEFALKMLRNDDNEAAERMLREARSAARVEHPAVVRIFDFGVTDRGDPFLVMDLLDGVTLRERLARGPLSPVDAVKLLLPVADGLHAAHSRGVMHRDVKTDNIVLVQDGAGRIQPTLIDFGIAKRLGPELQRLTMAGSVVGSPEYMSPEQARGWDLDHRTDVWSLSVVLYEALTGRTPFQRDGIAATLRAITDDPVTPLSDYGVDEPELDLLVQRGLAKLANARYADMRSFGEALARWLLARGVEADSTARSVRAVWFGATGTVPPVSLAVRAGDRRRRNVEMDIPGVPRRSGVTWILAALLSVILGFGAAVVLHAGVPPALTRAIFPILGESEGEADARALPPSHAWNAELRLATPETAGLPSDPLASASEAAALPPEPAAPPEGRGDERVAPTGEVRTRVKGEAEMAAEEAIRSGAFRRRTPAASPEPEALETPHVPTPPSIDLSNLPGHPAALAAPRRGDRPSVAPDAERESPPASDLPLEPAAEPAPRGPGADNPY